MKVLWFALVCLWDNHVSPVEYAGCSLGKGLGLPSCSCLIFVNHCYKRDAPVYFVSGILQITLFCKLAFLYIWTLFQEIWKLYDFHL